MIGVLPTALYEETMTIGGISLRVYLGKLFEAMQGGSCGPTPEEAATLAEFLRSARG